MKLMTLFCYEPRQESHIVNMRGQFASLEGYLVIGFWVYVLCSSLHG